MGFLGAIGAGIGAVGSAICGACSSIASSVGGAIGGAISAFTSVIGPMMNPLETIGIIGKIIHAIAEAFGLIEHEEKIDELGAKVAQDDTKKPEDFDSTEDYIKYLREEVELDREKFERSSPEEKAAYAVVGTTLITKSIEEKTDMKLSPEFLLTVAKCDMKQSEVTACMDSAKAAGITDMTAVADYLSGNKPSPNDMRIDSAIKEAIGKANPDMKQGEIDSKLDSMFDAANREL